jgi:hypothetical protein
VTIVATWLQPTAQTLPAPRQPTPFVIARPQAPPTQLRPKNPVFLDQICDGFLPLVVPQARKSHQQLPKRGDVHHGGKSTRPAKPSNPRLVG